MSVVLIILLIFSLLCNIIVFANKWKQSKTEEVKENSSQKFIRGKFEIPYSQRGVGNSWNVKDVSYNPDIIRKIYNHLSSAKKVYYEFFEIQDWDYFDTYTFYSNELKSWCRFVHRNGNFCEFEVYRTGRRYDINYQPNLQQVPEFWNYLMPMYEKHKEEYLKDNNL